MKKSDCGEWQWSVCVPTSGDCGLGTREGTRTGAECKQTMKTQRCKIPCNWKKQFGGESHRGGPVELTFHLRSFLLSSTQGFSDVDYHLFCQVHDNQTSYLTPGFLNFGTTASPQIKSFGQLHFVITLRRCHRKLC